MSNTNASGRLILQNVRFSYANVWEPKSINDGDPKYSVSVIISKDDTKQIEEVKKWIADATEAGKAKFGGKIPTNLKQPLRDGDEDRPDDEAYKGCMFFNANSTTAPAIVDAKRKPIMDQSEFYSGCYGSVSITFYAFNQAGNKGVAAGLGNLMKTKEGERLSGGASAEQDFGAAAADEDLG